jgi:hypothetical protein
MVSISSEVCGSELVPLLKGVVYITCVSKKVLFNKVIKIGLSNCDIVSVLFKGNKPAIVNFLHQL